MTESLGELKEIPARLGCTAPPGMKARISRGLDRPSQLIVFRPSALCRSDWEESGIGSTGKPARFQALKPPRKG
jgi:hypothetical protein